MQSAVKNIQKYLTRIKKGDKMAKLSEKDGAECHKTGFFRFIKIFLKKSKKPLDKGVVMW